MHLHKEASSFELEISYILIWLFKWNKNDTKLILVKNNNR